MSTLATKYKNALVDKKAELQCTKHRAMQVACYLNNLPFDKSC